MKDTNEKLLYRIEDNILSVSDYIISKYGHSHAIYNYGEALSFCSRTAADMNIKIKDGEFLSPKGRFQLIIDLYRCIDILRCESSLDTKKLEDKILSTIDLIKVSHQSKTDKND